MPRKNPTTVVAYVAQLPAARRKELERVRRVVRKHLPAGYEETLTRGMIVYQVPLARYPDTYNGHPLWYAALASQKSCLTLHLMPVYGSAPLAEKLRDGFKAAGKKLDMGKACIRFQTADDLALDTIADVVASTPLERFVAIAQAARRR
jgi:hypothetical protein